MQGEVVKSTRKVQDLRDMTRPWVGALLVIGSIVAETILIIGGF